LERAVRLKRPENRFVELLEAGADVNARDRGGHTSLHWACSYGRVNIARFLLEHGADPNVRETDYGRTPFEMCGPGDYRSSPWTVNEFLELFREYARSPRSRLSSSSRPMIPCMFGRGCSIGSASTTRTS
jgi:ankyrin repeat protein